MSPKDWDEEDVPEPGIRGKVRSRATKKNKPRSIQSEYLPDAEANAVVTEVHPKLCKVRLDTGGGDLLCSYRRVDVLYRAIGVFRERSPVAVGDRVKVSALGSRDGVVEGVTSRKNALWRMAPGDRESVIHVVGANLDGVVLVTSTHEPQFIRGVVDRYLIACLREGIPVVLVVNKMDLEREVGAEHEWDLYRELNLAEVIEASVKTGMGYEKIRERLATGTWLFCGHSGVGKTSLLRKLLAHDVGQVGQVNLQTGKGRHTTTSSFLYEAPEGGARWIDTPGVREFALSGMDPAVLADHFPEFQGLACTARGCNHLKQEECNAWGLARHASYLKIREDLTESAPGPRDTAYGPTRPGT